MTVENKRTRVLVVCMLDSIHTARWLNQFLDRNIDFHLFPSTPNRNIHPLLKEMIQKNSGVGQIKIHFRQPVLSILIWVCDFFLSNEIRGYLVRRLISKLSINIVHAMELNHAGYIVAKATKNISQSKTYIMATVWGSDIYWFQQFSKHKILLSNLLRKTELLISECLRDYDLAKKLDFKGEFFKSPSLFGYEQNEIMESGIPPSARRIILVKGYESFVGRASISLRALSEISSLIQEYEIHVYSTTLKSRRLIKKINRAGNLRITYYKKKSLSNTEIMNLFRQARIHIGVSLSDGVPASLLESIVTGAFPIQTNTSCAEQWVEDGTSGFLVAPNIEQVKLAIMKSLNNDELVDTAAEINRKTAQLRLNTKSVKDNLSKIYE